MTKGHCLITRVTIPFRPVAMRVQVGKWYIMQFKTSTRSPNRTPLGQSVFQFCKHVGAKLSTFYLFPAIYFWSLRWKLNFPSMRFIFSYSGMACKDRYWRSLCILLSFELVPLQSNSTLSYVPEQLIHFWLFENMRRPFWVPLLWLTKSSLITLCLAYLTGPWWIPVQCVQSNSNLVCFLDEFAVFRSA